MSVEKAPRLPARRILPSNDAPCDSPRWFHVGSGLSWARVGADAKLQGATCVLTTTLFELAPGGVLHGIKLRLYDSFSGGGITAYRLSLGVADDLTKYVRELDVHQATRDHPYLYEMLCGEGDHFPTQILLTAASEGANLSEAQTGAIDIWALLSATALA